MNRSSAAPRAALATRAAACAGVCCVLLAGLQADAHAAQAEPIDFAAPPARIARTVLDGEPGMVAVGLWRDGRAAYALASAPPSAQALPRSSGETPAPARITDPLPEAGQPLFEIGSISKLFTGLLLAQAVERGELALDDSLGSLLAGQVKLDGAVASITLRQLVTHGSCLPREPQDFPGYRDPNPFARHGRWQLLSGLSQITLAQAPPCAGFYSNFGMGLLGQILADRAGRPWAALVRDRITGPLGMDDTHQQLAEGEQAARLAPGWAHRDPQAPWDFDALAGAGALRSTPADLLRLARALMAGRDGPLGGAAERMLTPLARYFGQEIGYAVMVRGPEGRRTYYHDGLTAGHRALLVFAPDSGEAAAVLASNTHAGTNLALVGITAARYPVPAGLGTPPDAAALGELAGVYRVTGPTSVTVVAQDGRLYRRIGGAGFRPLQPAGADVFVDPAYGVRYAFRREAGQPVALDYTQGGSGFMAIRTAQPAPALAVPRPAPDAALAYAGQYRSRGSWLHRPLRLEVRAEEGQLFARTANRWAQPVFPMDGRADRFVDENGRAQLQFVRDAQGRVTGAVLHDGGPVRLDRLD